MPWPCAGAIGLPSVPRLSLAQDVIGDGRARPCAIRPTRGDPRGPGDLSVAPTLLLGTAHTQAAPCKAALQPELARSGRSALRRGEVIQVCASSTSSATGSLGNAFVAGRHLPEEHGRTI